MRRGNRIVTRLRNVLAPLLVTGAAVLTGSRGLAAEPQPYQTSAAHCDGFPRVEIDLAPGLCAGLVWAPTPGDFHHRAIRTPRMLLELPGDQGWLVTDLGAWTDRLGKVWRLKLGSAGASPVELVKGLTLPHTISYGPDGNIYVAEMNRIFRLDATTGASNAVITGLPGNRLHIGRHPLSHFLFDANGDLLVNVGADTDQCSDAAGHSPTDTCTEAEGNDARAVIRRYAYRGSGRWEDAPSIEARGLRNSLVLVRHSSGTILQAENSYDFAPTADRPYDEINLIRRGAFYGWPYCYDLNQSTPAWASAQVIDCHSPAHSAPVALLPPHAAPLGAVYYAGDMFPLLRGKLLMSWHGYRPTGSRIVAFDVDRAGVPVITARARYPEYGANGIGQKLYEGPASEPMILTPGWDLKPGKRPAGAPVALTVARDGAIWVADDRNAAILRIAADKD